MPTKTGGRKRGVKKTNKKGGGVCLKSKGANFK